jgi:hypothetical protein
MPEARFHHQGHDSFLMAVPVSLLGAAASLIKQHLTTPIELEDITGKKRTLTIPVEVAAGYSWLAMKEWKGEQELKKEEWEEWASKKYSAEALKRDLLHVK